MNTGRSEKPVKELKFNSEMKERTKNKKANLKSQRLIPYSVSILRQDRALT